MTIPIKKCFYVIVFSSLLTTLYGCESILPAAHRINVDQGNVIDSKQLDQLRPGISREQVRFLLGSPVNQNVFHSDRWDYLHYISKAGTYADPIRVTVFFENDQVIRIEDQYEKAQLELETQETPSEELIAVERPTRDK